MTSRLCCLGSEDVLSTDCGPEAAAAPSTGRRSESSVARRASGLLQAEGDEVWLVHWQTETYATRSRAKAGAIRVPVPSLDPEGFVHALVAAAVELRPATILPGGESSLIALAGREDEFPVDVVVGTFPPDLVRRATDKQALAEVAEAAGLATPPTEIVNREDLLERAEKLAYPFVLKAARSLVSDSNGSLRRVETRRVDSSDDLVRAMDSLQSSPVLVQQYVPGVLRTVCGVAWRGQLVCSLLQENARLWPPGFGVASLAISLPRDPELEQATTHIVRALELSGVFQVEFLIDGEERYLIDINPRIYSSMGAAIAAGLNLPAVWVELLLGGSPQVSKYRVGVRWRVEDSELRLLKRAVLRGDRRAISELVRPRRGTVHAAFALHDPGPAFITVRRLLRTLRVNTRRLLRWPPAGVG